VNDDTRRQRVYTSSQVAALLGVSTSTVNRWFDTQKLSGYREANGQARLIPRDGLLRFLRAEGRVVPGLTPTSESAAEQFRAALAAATGNEAPAPKAAGDQSGFTLVVAFPLPPPRLDLLALGKPPFQIDASALEHGSDGFTLRLTGWFENSPLAVALHLGR
jgi:excisionase family DNA binding protein